MQFEIDVWFRLVLQLKKIVIMILVSLWHFEGKNYYQIFLLLDISMIKSKKVMILYLRPHFKKHMFKI